MAGDHKCPVCQSTFTRPQHVARHMRSHTGDRPYKCQHCGDQFARSDLLSRHINKCHASEKPPTTTAPNRRKGSAAASRATTSKQACDQCVQSSLPCDGANPCSKCVQRKCRCTYVKFHRQTAPQGPGHPVPNQLSQPSRTTIAGSSRLSDDFILGPPQTQFAFPSMYAPNAGTEYTLPPTSTTLYGYNPSDPHQSPASSMTLSASTRDSLSSSSDVMARYHAQAELLSRANALNGPLAVMGSGAPPAADNAMSANTLYSSDPHAQSHFNRFSLPMPAASWAHSNDAHTQQSFQGVDEHDKEYDPAYRQPFHTRERRIATGSGEPTLQAHPTTHGATFPPLSSTVGGAGGYSGDVGFQRHSDDLNDDFGSDAGSNERSHSIPSSAASSSVHLPLPDSQQQQARQSFALREFSHFDAAQDAGNNPHNIGHKHEYSGSFENDGQGEGGFSSAFGLMSLDDPNVLAGLSTDSAPFFSNMTPGAGGTSSLNFATPTQDILSALKAGKNDMDSKEMRDFWKMYVRTPLSGPGSANMLSLATPTGPGQTLGSRPSPSRRHSRVASLPSMKTPPLLSDVNSGALPPLSRFAFNDGTRNDGSRNMQFPHSEHESDQRDRNANANANAFSSIRTTLHGGDDLKSYEQAVLARRAPMNLNLVPKRRGTMPPRASATSSILQQQQSSDAKASSSVNASPVAPHLPPPPPPFMSNKIPDLLNRPSSTASNSSSLAHAFGATDSNAHPQTQQATSRPPSQSGPSGMRPPSVASSTVVGSDAGHDFDPSFRPSFKRLASQTLGPENSKRALLGPAGWDDDARQSLSTSTERGSSDVNRLGSAYDRSVVGLLDRQRRSSYPMTGMQAMQPLRRAEESGT
ncbi:uncharacterized protein LAESUDRAFT_743565 [Laetiporus sulphureus 93-53]|uniref:Zn(2)-C6 fungal-type domain-containing protein n=1 Tax=Laetiporus sulphureus 93-53 TaxID=1314785 RepID=A0A165E283_9APHY|nr:uncharacterized protein LAESUDRAFT_743565 [Laetiporus sulphureus 93-53]KZT06104.1 hypothetical protein LAESUDRAFT_743565 [Laetiporus sulphureus 93-53]